MVHCTERRPANFDNHFINHTISKGFSGILCLSTWSMDKCNPAYLFLAAIAGIVNATYKLDVERLVKYMDHLREC